MMHPFSQISEEWFLTEPALFQIFCSHRLEENKQQKCAVRAGKGMLEYHPQLCASLSKKKLEEYLRAEVIRILLKHPYERQPECCSKTSAALGSNCVLGDNYKFQNIPMHKPSDFGLESKQHFEWYAIEIEKILQSSNQPEMDSNLPIADSEMEGGDAFSSKSGKPNGSSGSEENDQQSDLSDSEENDQQSDSSGSEENDQQGDLSGSEENNQQGDSSGSEENNQQGDLSGSEENDQQGDSSGSEGEEQKQIGNARGLQDLASLWEKDEFMIAQINCMIHDISENRQWGTIPQNLIEEIIASTKARIDYKKILAGFRATILSQKRRLTRMRPNRRFDFEAMGSRYDFCTRLLVGIDVSGSVTTQELRDFYSIVCRFFKYGIPEIDVVQFDTELKKVESIRKFPKKIKTIGRGGTCYQPLIDYVAKQPYDGVLIFTDGYAPTPVIPSSFHTPLCWVLTSEDEYKENGSMLRSFGRVCVLEK